MYRWTTCVTTSCICADLPDRDSLAWLTRIFNGGFMLENSVSGYKMVIDECLCDLWDEFWPDMWEGVCSAGFLHVHHSIAALLLSFIRSNQQVFCRKYQFVFVTASGRSVGLLLHDRWSHVVSTWRMYLVRLTLQLLSDNTELLTSEIPHFCSWCTDISIDDLVLVFFRWLCSLCWYKGRNVGRCRSLL